MCRSGGAPNTTCVDDWYHPSTCHSERAQRVEESSQVAGFTLRRLLLLLGKIPPLHFISVGMTCRWVVPFNRTGCIRNVAGGIVAAPTGVVPIIRTGYILDAPGTAHRPFPTVSLIGVFFNQRIPKTSVFCFPRFHLAAPVTRITVNCQLSTVNLNQLSIFNVYPGRQSRPWIPGTVRPG